MCGIAAIFAYDPNAPCVEEGELTVVRDHMTVRGPDGCGNWLDSQRRVGLGHRRLSIIDLSDAGAQPMHFGHLAIVFNGEIYNYRGLRASLEQRGHVFKSNCDTEVLLHLYAEKGRAMTDDLRGMYAFAIWDGEKRGLFMARDPYGIKPLYVADDGKTLRVASQVKALLAGGRIDTSAEPAGHVGFFLWGHMPDPYTLYRGIRALPAGNSLWIDGPGGKQQQQFCSIPAMLAKSEIGNRKSEIFQPSDVSVSTSQLSASLKDSVAHHLIADVPVGVFLSSGLDSTTLAALAAEQGGQLRTVTLGFENYRGTADDETPLAETVARQYGAQHQTVWISRGDFETNTGRLFTVMDRPSVDGVNTYFVSLAAARTGLKVALSGLGGDELFGGYPSFTEIPKSVRTFQRFSLSAFQPFNRAVRAVSAPVLRRFTSPKYAGLLEYGGSFGGAYLLRRGMFMPWELPGFLDADFVRQGWSELRMMSRLEETVAGLQCPRAKVTALETCWYMRHQLLCDSDWAGMAHSLEIRVPLVDIQLLKSLAPMLCSENPPTKRDMAAAPRSALPAAVLNRSKTGFQVPVRQWLLEANPDSQLSTINSQPSIERGLRGWARYVHSRFPGSDCVLARKSVVRGRKVEIGNRQSAIVNDPSTVLALVTDAYGGHGGIAKFNRDLLSSLCSDPNIEKVVAIPRLIPEPTGTLPDKLEFVTGAAGGKLRFAFAVLRTSVLRPPPSVIVCGHINLLPFAFLVRRILSFRFPRSGSPSSVVSGPESPSQPSTLNHQPPIALIIHGIDAWQPTGRNRTNRLAQRVDAVVAVSEFTREKFWSWAQPKHAGSFILPNCVDLSEFTPGPKSSELLDRYGLRDRTVLLTVARLSAQERYKGIDEVLEVLPELSRTIPNICYMIVGDGTDRARLIAKAKSLGLTVNSADDRGQRAEGSRPTSVLSPRSSAVSGPPSAFRPQVLFAGRIPESEKVAHYRLADAFVMAGWGEGFGIVYLEAMACGVPSVASKLDASKEAMRDGQLGVLVNPRVPEEIVNGTLMALRSPKGVPAGLDHFSQANFQHRVHAIVCEIAAR